MSNRNQDRLTWLPVNPALDPNSLYWPVELPEPDAFHLAREQGLALQPLSEAVVVGWIAAEHQRHLRELVAKRCRRDQALAQWRLDAALLEAGEFSQISAGD
jgi:hypothetical protein